MSEPFDQWAIVEIMGHNVYAGRVSEQTIGGTAFVRVDVPEIDGRPGFSKLFGDGAIYAITIVSEDVAMLRARALKQTPLSVYDLPESVRSAIMDHERMLGAKHEDEVYVGDDGDDE